MKNPVVFLVALSFLFFSGASHAQTTNVYWSFTGGAISDNAATIPGLSTAFTNGNAPSLSFNNSASAVSTNYTTAAGYTASGGNYAVLTDRPGAFDTGTNGYFSFSLSLDSSAGISYQITDISLGSRSTGTGPTQLSLYESLNGTIFTTSLGSVSVLENSIWAAIDFSGISISLPDDGSTVYFRLYGTTPAKSAGNSNWQIDDLAATIVATPEPSHMVLATLGGIVCLVALIRRRQFFSASTLRG